MRPGASGTPVVDQVPPPGPATEDERPRAGRAPARGVRDAASAWARALLVLVAVVGVDQGTKALVRSSIVAGDRHNVFLGVDLVHAQNDGVAFGFLSGGGAPVIALSALALAAIVVYFARRPGRAWVWLPTGLLLGGAVGNVIDRVRMGAVTDFIDLPLWPPFNVADMCITCGVVALLLVIEASSRGTPRA